MFGGRDPIEVGPNDSEKFTFVIYPRIETASKFKGAVSFEGTGSSWTRPSFYFRINKEETKFTESCFEDESTTIPYIRLGQPFQLESYEVTATNISLMPSPSGDESDTTKRRVKVETKVANTTNDKIRAYLSFEAYEHLGEELTCGTLGQSSGGDQNGIQLNVAQIANFQRYIEVSEENEDSVIYCTLQLSESGWDREPPKFRLRIHPDNYKD